MSDDKKIDYGMYINNETNELVVLIGVSKEEETDKNYAVFIKFTEKLFTMEVQEFKKKFHKSKQEVFITALVNLSSRDNKDLIHTTMYIGGK